MLRSLLLFVVSLGFISSPVHGEASSELLAFENAWVRLTPAVVENTAAYFVISNTSEQEVTIKSVTTPVAKSSALHDMVNENGGMRMEHMPIVVLKPGESMRFRPGGKHLMLMGLYQPLKAGDKIEVTFDLGDLPSQTVAMMVHKAAPEKHKHH